MELSKPTTYNDSAEIMAAWRRATAPFRVLIEISAEERQRRFCAVAENIFSDEMFMDDTHADFISAMGYVAMLITLSLQENCPADEILVRLDEYGGVEREIMSLILCEAEDDFAIHGHTEVSPDRSWVENFVFHLSILANHVMLQAWRLAAH